MNKDVKAIIFDLDGTLVDSEPLQYQAFNEVFSRYGHPVSPEEYDQWRGWQVVPRWIEARGLTLQPEPIREQKKLIYDRLIRDEVTLKPGARQLVEKGAEHFRLAIASGSRRDSIAGCMEKFDLVHHFDVFCSTTEVDRGKPDPDVLLETARRLRVAPENVVVIEDSITGLGAANAAGMSCIVCPDSFLPAPPEALGGAALIVSSLEEISLENIKQLAAGE